MALLNPHQREAIDLLRASPLVKSVHISFYKIRVVFQNGLRENYFLNGLKKPNHKFIPKYDLWLKDIPTYCEFESKPFDDEFNRLAKPFFCIQYSDFAQAGFLTIRLKIHEIIKDCLAEGWVNPKYPREILLNDWNILKSLQFTKKFTLNRLQNFKKGNINAMKILLHHLDDAEKYFDPRRVPMSVAWKDPKWLRKAIESCLRRRKDVTRASIISELGYVRRNKTSSGIQFVNPIMYRILIGDLLKFQSPKVLHVNSDTGSGLLATGLLGGQYYCLNMTDSLTNIASLIGVQAREFDGSEVDVCFDSLLPSGIVEFEDRLKKYRKVAKTTILCVNPEDVESAMKIAKPDRIIQKRRNYWEEYYGGILIYNSK